MLERLSSWGRAGLVTAAILTVPLWLGNMYYLGLASTIAMYSIAALGARLLLLLGLWSFGQGAFLTIGAYTSAILMVNFGLSFWVALPVAALGGAAAAAIIGYPALRLRGVYFAILTIVLVLALSEAIILFPGVTHGASGFAGIPPPSPITVGGIEFSSASPSGLFAIIAVLLLLTMGIMYRIDHSRLAKVLAAIRQNEVVAESIGTNLTRYRMGAFVIAAFVTTAAGAFSAEYYGIAHPDIWGLWPSIFIITYAIIGFGSVVGPVIVATAGTLIEQFLGATEGLQGILLGVALIIVGFMLPSGASSISFGKTVNRIISRIPAKYSASWEGKPRWRAHRAANDSIAWHKRNAD